MSALRVKPLIGKMILRKKSFKLEIDEVLEQDLLGYDNLNLNCGFGDEAHMREVLYYDISKNFTTSLKACFIDLYINGQYWGPYHNVQQIEGRYLQEWFTNNDGTRWRAERVGGGGPGGGPGGPFGTGFSTLNYNGPDSSNYNQYYTLKKTSKENPWIDLIEICDILNNTPIDDLYENLKDVFDIDRTLWFLVQEIVFSDDDSYIYKGGMDYYVYWDESTNRLMPMEVDGNSVMAENHYTWSPFYNENDPDFPLMNRMLQNQEIRQRYLAHLRTVLENYFVVDNIHARIDSFTNLLDQKIQNDPKKIYTYDEHKSGIEDLKSWIEDRSNFLSGYPEIDVDGLEIQSLKIKSENDTEPSVSPNEAPIIEAIISGDVEQVNLYYGIGLDGTFEKIEMFDDGLLNDEQAEDGVFTAIIPGAPAGYFIRYYVEAIKNDQANTASYFPKGAEHDVYIYQVESLITAPGDLVINELMADNESYVSDLEGDYDDWIELYNNGSNPIDLSGYFLSDDLSNIDKWSFPEGTMIDADQYLIIWADEDQETTDLSSLHANFKLSSNGESVTLSNPDEEIVDQIIFGPQEEDLSLARVPNGTGSFQKQDPTFNANNDGSSQVSEIKNELFTIYPNPTCSSIMINLSSDQSNNFQISLFNAQGMMLFDKKALKANAPIDLSYLNSGIYFINISMEGKNVGQKKLFVIK